MRTSVARRKKTAVTAAIAAITFPAPRNRKTVITTKARIMDLSSIFM
jgi:hypothetical protein